MIRSEEIIRDWLLPGFFIEESIGRQLLFFIGYIGFELLASVLA